MIDKEGTRALKRIEEAESQPEQPVEDISSAFLHASLDRMTEKIQQHTRELNNSVRKTGFVQCFDTNEGYYQVPHMYCLAHTPHVH